MMRTRDVQRWHHSVKDMQQLVLLAVAGLMMGMLDAACGAVESWIDRRAARVDAEGEVYRGP